MITKHSGFIVLFLCSTATGLLVGEDNNPSSDGRKFLNDSVLSDILSFYNTYQNCANENVVMCLKVKLLTSLNKLIAYPKDISISNDIYFARNEDIETNARSATANFEYNLKKQLPKSSQTKNSELNSMILNAVFSLLKSRKLRIQDFAAKDANFTSSEGRKKKDKKGGGAFVMIPLLLGGTFIPIAYGALALLAGKALIVSKLALVLASIIGIKKLLTSSSGKESQHEVVVSNSHSTGSAWGRDFDLVYNAQSPTVFSLDA